MNEIIIKVPLRAFLIGPGFLTVRGFLCQLNKTYQISRPAKAPIAVGSDVIVVKLRDDKAGFKNL